MLLVVIHDWTYNVHIHNYIAFFSFFLSTTVWQDVHDTGRQSSWNNNLQKDHNRWPESFSLPPPPSPSSPCSSLHLPPPSLSPSPSPVKLAQHFIHNAHLLVPRMTLTRWHRWPTVRWWSTAWVLPSVTSLCLTRDPLSLPGGCTVINWPGWSMR